MNHQDTSCEFHHENKVEAKHQHCEMLAFEISSFDHDSIDFRFIQIENVDAQNTHKYRDKSLSFSCQFYLRGPPNKVC